jgi:Domain of unknown function (DUF4158)/Bacterial dnaA protein helix-turn-helix
MPRRSLLSSAERDRLFVLPDTQDELIRYYTLTESDRAIANQHRGSANRLGFAVQLCYMRYPGRMLSADEAPFPPLLKLVVQTRICPGCGRPVYERLSAAPIERVIEIVGKFYGVGKADLLGADRTQHVAMVRHVAMYLARTYCRLSYPELGGVFGRDHSSVIHAVRMIESRIRNQPAFAKFLARLESAIRNDGEQAAA